MLREIATTKKRASEQIPTSASRRGNNFMHGCFVAPDEFRTAVNHSAEEIHVGARAAHFNSERRDIRRQNAAKEQHISGARLRPSQKKTGRVRRPLEKSPFNRPGWRFKIESR